MKDVGRWSFVCILLVLLPAKLFYFDLLHWIYWVKNQPGFVLHVLPITALMAGEVVLLVVLVGGSIFAGVKVLRSSASARASVLYLTLAVFAYYLAWPFFYELSMLLPSGLSPEYFPHDSHRPFLETWISAAVWTSIALLGWYLTFPRTAPNREG